MGTVESSAKFRFDDEHANRMEIATKCDANRPAFDWRFRSQRIPSESPGMGMAGPGALTQWVRAGGSPGIGGLIFDVITDTQGVCNTPDRSKREKPSKSEAFRFPLGQNRIDSRNTQRIVAYNELSVILKPSLEHSFRSPLRENWPTSAYRLPVGGQVLTPCRLAPRRDRRQRFLIPRD